MTADRKDHFVKTSFSNYICKHVFLFCILPAVRNVSRFLVLCCQIHFIIWCSRSRDSITTQSLPQRAFFRPLVGKSRRPLPFCESRLKMGVYVFSCSPYICMDVRQTSIKDEGSKVTRDVKWGLGAYSLRKVWNPEALRCHFHHF